MSVSVDAVANFVVARSNVEATSAVASKVIQIEQQAAQGIIQALQQSQANLAAAAEEISAPTLDGTGGIVDRSI